VEMPRWSRMRRTIRGSSIVAIRVIWRTIALKGSERDDLRACVDGSPNPISTFPSTRCFMTTTLRPARPGLVAAVSVIPDRSIRRFVHELPSVRFQTQRRALRRPSEPLPQLRAPSEVEA
jgi:hypothetical protein